MDTLNKALTTAGYIHPWNGRFYSLWDTGYAIVHLPLIASVSEHQPTQYAQYFTDLSCLPLFGAAGLYFCFQKLDDGCLFLIIYALFSAYFSGIMVRLMLALAPIICILAAISLSTTIETILAPDEEKNQIEEILEVAQEATEETTEASQEATEGEKEGAEATEDKKEAKKILVKVKKTPWTEYLKNEIFVTKWISLILVACALGHYAYHSEYVIERFYSSPSIILTGRVRGNEESGLLVSTKHTFVPILYGFVRNFTHLYEFVHTCTQDYLNLFASKRICMDLYASVRICTHLYEFVHIYKHICTELYVFVLTCTHLDALVRTCTHVYALVPICTYLNSFF